MPRLRNASACLRAAAQSVAWLKAHCAAEEKSPCRDYPLWAYHKVPYLFLLTGDLETCRTVLAWIVETLLLPGGDLRAGADENAGKARAGLREMAWVTLGAHLACRYELSLPLLEELLERQGPNTGGLYERGADGRLESTADIRATACGGLVFLACGQLAQARRAGQFLVRAVQQQIGSKRFLLRMDNLGQPVRKYPQEASASHVLSTARGKTAFGYLGLPMVLLTRLNLATGEGEWLDAAMDYYSVAERYGKQSWVGPEVGMLAWGAAALYDRTRRRIYYDAAEAAAQALIQSLGPDGAWSMRSGNEPTTVACTAEAAVSLLEAVREAR